MRNLYFANLRSDGTIRIPQAVIDEMMLTVGTGFAIEPDPSSKFLYLQILPANQRNRKPDKTAPEKGMEGEPS